MNAGSASGPEADRLLAELDGLADLSCSHPAERWGDRPISCAAEIRRVGGILWQHLPMLFGGMEGLNDVVSQPTNGNAVAGEDLRALDRLLREPRGAVWERGQALLRMGT